jgi:hypothetical protein
MRKLFWGGLTAGVAFAVGLCGVAQYALWYPESLAGRCFCGAPALAERLSQTGQTSPYLEEAEEPALGAEGLPAEPVPVAEEPVGEKPGLPLAGVIKIYPEPPGEPEPPVTIPEEEPPAVPPALDGNPLAIEVPVGPGPCVAFPPGCPASMPYCHDEECEELAPPAEEAEAKADSRPEAAAADAALNFWVGFFGERGEPGPAPAPVSFTEALSRFWTGLLQEAYDSVSPEEGEAALPKSEAGPADCCEDPHRHYQCPACPYTGQSYPRCPATGGCAPRPQAAPGGEGGASKRKKCEEDDCPIHPEVDTMEYRRSDGNLHDYGAGNPL